MPAAKTRSRIEPRKAEPLDLSRDASVRALAAAAIAEACAQFFHNAQGVQRAPEAELVHQTRVALRKLRVFVRLFRAVLPQAAQRSLDAELHWLFLVLGRLRDLQVFERDQRGRGDLTPRMRSQLARQLAPLLARARAALDTALASPRYAALCAALLALEAHVASARGSRTSARAFLAKRLTKRMRRVRASIAMARRDARERHPLRKQLKKLRYTLELALALEPKHRKRALKLWRALRDVQDTLGAVVDAQVARRIVGRLSLEPGLKARLRAHLDQASAAQLSQLAPLLDQLEAARAFWR